MKTAIAIGWLLCVVSQLSAAANPAPAAGIPLSPWAEIGAVSAVCIALVLLVTKVIPAGSARHAKTIEGIEARHAKTVEGVCDRFAETVDKATQQQAESAKVIRDLAVQCQARGT